MGKYSYPIQVRKVKEGEEYVAARPIRYGNIRLEPGDLFDVAMVTRQRLRQLLEWQHILPRWRYNEVNCIVEDKPQKKKKKKVGRTKRGDHVISA